MTKQQFEGLIRRTLGDLRRPGCILTPIDIDDVPGVLCFVVSSPSGDRRYIYADLYDQDEDRVISDIRRQLEPEPGAAQVAGP